MPRHGALVLPARAKTRVERLPVEVSHRDEVLLVDDADLAGLTTLQG
jgi:hypothetical protein